MSIKDYKKLKSNPGIYKHKKSGKFMARKKIDGKNKQLTFASLHDAVNWRRGVKKSSSKTNQYSTLKDVWKEMQKSHFPTLAKSTVQIWHRRFEPWKSIEHLTMDQITPSRITTWVNNLTDYYRSDYYQSSGRGRSARCNLNNELSLFVTIFNWYKESESFEQQAVLLTCPVKKKHRKLGFIKPTPDRKKQIDLNDALTFFEYLRPMYKDLAMMQFFTAGRIGEIAGLQWSNVDIGNKRLLIKHTCTWCMTHKTFLELKPFPKNKESRACFITNQILEILIRRKHFKIPDNDFVFHVEGKPLNYGTIQLNYREAQRKAKLPYSGTHILRHGMAKLARKVGGGLDAVVAMTGHKDLKLADHYSKSNEDDQKEFSLKIMDYIQNRKNDLVDESEKIISLNHYRKSRFQ